MRGAGSRLTGLRLLGKREVMGAKPVVEVTIVVFEAKQVGDALRLPVSLDTELAHLGDLLSAEVIEASGGTLPVGHLENAEHGDEREVSELGGDF